MINLLPPDVKENILYARRNTLLVRWIIALLVVVTGIFIVVLVGHVYLSRTISSYEEQIATTETQLKEQKLEETQARVQEMSSNLNLVVDVLSKQVLFSSLLKQIGAAIPSGAVLTGLSINQVQGGIDLTAAAEDYNTATQVQVNLQDPANQIFQQADIVNIQCNSEVADDSPLRDYPCIITLRALFAENNSFSFINANQENSR